MRSEVTVIFQSSPPVRQWVLSVPKRPLIDRQVFAAVPVAHKLQ